MSASVMLKSIKFAQLLNQRLCFSTVKYFNTHLVLSQSITTQIKAYATAAYKLVPDEQTNLKVNDARSHSTDNTLTVVDSISKLDLLIRRNGRTQLKNVRKILSAINSKDDTSSLHGLYLLRSCKYCYDEPPSIRIEFVNQIWNKYQELGIEFDVRHYNALLDVHVGNCLDFNPAEILASMEDSNVHPNKDTYMLIMKKYCQDGNISGASEILEYMKEKQIPADEKVFNYLIEGHVKNNDVSGALEMVDVMRASKLEPTAHTHGILASGYAAIGNKDEMLNHLKACDDVDSAENHLKAIEILANSGNHQFIDDVLSLIQNKERYVQEFINSAVKLMHKNFIAIAYKLVLASCSPSYNEGMNVFIKQLIKVGKESSEVLSYCEKIYSEGLTKNVFTVASRAAVEYDKFEHVVPLLKKSQDFGYHVRPSTFNQFFAEDTSEGRTWKVLKAMCDLGTPCDARTYIDVVLPSLGAPPPNTVLHEVQKSGQALETAADALFVYYCSTGQLHYANQLTETFPVKLCSKFDSEEFLRMHGTLRSEDMANYVKLLRFIFRQDSIYMRQFEIQGKFLTELILKKQRLLETLLEKYEDLKFSEKILNFCRQELSEKNPHKLAFLQKLRTLNVDRKSIFKEKNMSIEDEDTYIDYLQAQNISSKPFLVKRIFHHIRSKNITRVNQLLSLFDELKLEYTPLMLSNLIGLWCAAADLEKAKDTVEKLAADFPGFRLDLSRALEYVSLLIKYEKFDESYEILKESVKGPHTFSNDDMVVRSLKRFGATLSDTQNIDFTRKMQNLVLPVSNEFGARNALLDPPIFLFLNRNDLKSALDEFKSVAKTHRVPSCLNILLKKAINANEKDILQQVVDITTSCAGKTYALLELAVAFIETYNSQKALKVIETLGSETDSKVLENFCNQLSNKNKLTELESLIFMTKSLKHIDREGLYLHAFRACVNRNDFDRAVKVFENLKEEIVDPAPKTMKIVQDLFEKNNQTLPVSLIAKDQTEINSLSAEATKDFREQLEAGDAEAALKELSALKKGYIRTLSIKFLTDLVDLCLQKNCVYDLSLNTPAMSYIIENVKDVFKPLLEKYSESGDVDKFVRISSFIPDFSLIHIGFNNYLCNAFISSGKYEDLLSQFEERTHNKNKLFSSTAFVELLKFPEYEDRLFNLALKYLDAGFNIPIAIIWAHYFSKENFEKADEIFKKYTFQIDRIDNVIFNIIKQDENVTLAKKYVEFIKNTSLRPRAKIRAYGSAVDLLVFKGRYDEAVDLVVEAEKQDLQLNKYYLSTLGTLKSALEKENKPVPFCFPLHEHQSGSSSDSKNQI